MPKNTSKKRRLAVYGFLIAAMAWATVGSAIKAWELDAYSDDYLPAKDIFFNAGPFDGKGKEVPDELFVRCKQFFYAYETAEEGNIISAPFDALALYTYHEDAVAAAAKMDSTLPELAKNNIRHHNPIAD